MIVKRKKIYQIFIFTIIFGLSFEQLKAQDQHLASADNISMWYNPSQKSDKDLTLKMNYRDLRYQGLIGFRSTVGMLAIPIKTGNSKELDQKGFWNVNLGFSLDESNQNILKNTQALLGLSYAVPLSANNTYLAVSVQGSYYNSRLDLSNTSFPDQFDRNGPISNAITNDPLASGDSKDWYSSHLGMSLFQKTDDENWSLGVSLRDVTQPEINRQSSTQFNLKPTLFMQGSYDFTRGQMMYGIQGFFSLKSAAYQQLLSMSVRHKLNDNNFKSIGSGVAYRFRDAVIPYLDLNFKQTTVAIYYEMNVSGINASGYSRRAFELSVSHRFAKKDKN